MARPTSPDARPPSFWRQHSGILGAIAILAVLVLVTILLGSVAGCKSATADISGSAVAAGRDANGIVQHANDAIAEVENPPAEVPATPDVVAWLGAIKSHLVAIVAGGENVKKSSARIIERVPDVQDKVPWWASLLKLFAVLGILAVSLYFFVASGAFKVVRGIVWGMGKLIPARALTAAKFDFEYHQKNPDDAEHREAVAANRGKDQAYDAAWKKHKREAEAKEPTP